MKFALLGIDDELLTLARELTARGEHTIVALYELGEHADAARQLAPDADHKQQWESLLLEDVVEGVLVGRGGSSGDARADQLKKLVQAKVPLVVVHPACEYIDGYEIEMIRRDVGGIIIPYYPGISDPALDVLLAKANSTVEQIAFERRQANRTRSAVLVQLARDAEIARRLLGSVSKVGAFGTLHTDSPSALTVQMTNDKGRSVRWSIEPESDAPRGVLRFAREQDQVVLALPDPAASLPGFCEQLPSLLRGEAMPAVTWIDCCRAQEVADTVPRCLARGRSIDLYNEEHTEEGAFKGVMAVGGCLLLMLGLLGVVFVAVVEGLQLPLYRFALWSNWPLYLCAVFFFFLLLQLLKLVARRS